MYQTNMGPSQTKTVLSVDSRIHTRGNAQQRAKNVICASRSGILVLCVETRSRSLKDFKQSLNVPAPGKTTTCYVEESAELSTDSEEDYLYFIDLDIFRDDFHWGPHTSIFKVDKVKRNNFKTTLFVRIMCLFYFI